MEILKKNFIINESGLMNESISSYLIANYGSELTYIFGISFHLDCQ